MSDRPPTRLTHPDDWIGVLAMALDEETGGRHRLLAELDEWRMWQADMRLRPGDVFRRRPLPWEQAA